ncbi:MAG: TonB-dependent receptor domain-containing protein, partial [Rhizomicrobium sp.]
NIDLTGSIAMIGTDTVLLLCYQGQRQFCDNITRTNGAVTQIALSYFNLAAQTTRGIDFESRYRFSLTDIDPAWAGEVALRGNATVNLKNYINDGLSPPTNDVGTARFGAAPYWRLSASATYTYDALQASLTARAFSAGHLNNTWIECTSGCPPTTAANPTIDSNRAPGALYFDSSVSYAFQASDAHLQAFFNIKNLLDRAPGYEPMRGFGLPYNAFPTDSMYDELGRVFRVGIRFAL